MNNLTYIGSILKRHQMLYYAVSSYSDVYWIQVIDLPSVQSALAKNTIFHTKLLLEIICVEMRFSIQYPSINRFCELLFEEYPKWPHKKIITTMSYVVVSYSLPGQILSYLLHGQCQALCTSCTPQLLLAIPKQLQV